MCHRIAMPKWNHDDRDWVRPNPLVLPFAGAERRVYDPQASFFSFEMCAKTPNTTSPVEVSQFTNALRDTRTIARGARVDAMNEVMHVVSYPQGELE